MLGAGLPSVNPVLGAGLPPSTLCWAQDCSQSRPASRLRISEVTQKDECEDQAFPHNRVHQQASEEGAGDAHVVVVGRADVRVGGRAQPAPAAEGVASPRRQRVGAHDVPGEGAQGHGVALSWKPQAGRGHGALAVGARQKIS